MKASMKFDAARADSLAHELAESRYAGPDGVANAADLVAHEFEAMGLRVERRDLVGSRPRRVAAQGIGWLIYGLLLTAVYALIRPDSVVSAILALALLNLGFYWLGAVLAGRIRSGRGRTQVESAPIVIAFPAGAPPSPARVVFQAALGGLSPEVFHPIKWAYRVLLLLKMGAIVLFWCGATFRILSFLAIRMGASLLPDRLTALLSHANLIFVRDLLPGLLVLAWVGITGLFLWELRQARDTEVPSRIDRRGLAVLLELARAWPRTGTRPIEPVFVAAGGHRLEDTGSREEVLRLLRPEWSHSPSLLLVFVEPGAGEGVALFTMDSRYADLYELAERAARDLWMPIRACESLPSSPLLPFGVDHPLAVLIGSDPRVTPGDAADPQALHRASQLATEIALRWARKPPPAPTPPDSPG
jgi:hypothetical protein